MAWNWSWCERWLGLLRCGSESVCAACRGVTCCSTWLLRVRHAHVRPLLSTRCKCTAARTAERLSSVRPREKPTSWQRPTPWRLMLTCCTVIFLRTNEKWCSRCATIITCIVKVNLGKAVNVIAETDIKLLEHLLMLNYSEKEKLMSPVLIELPSLQPLRLL